MALLTRSRHLRWGASRDELIDAPLTRAVRGDLDTPSRSPSGDAEQRRNAGVATESPAMPLLRVTPFGGFQARLDDTVALALPTRMAQALLAYLALRPGVSQPTATWKPASSASAGGRAAAPEASRGATHHDSISGVL
ncbi:MAG: hypothetical protein HYU25_06100 [Candidatus Rokubacteria bacterium]|nr:hypothetical protein [Candidatus Rokubacteria bacterium]